MTSPGLRDTAPATLNLIGQTWRVRDTAGELFSVRTWTEGEGEEEVTLREAFDVDGNPLVSVRRFCVGFRDLPDWSAAPALQDDAYATQQRFDGLQRPTLLTTPDGTEQAFTYDAGGRLFAVDVTSPGEAARSVLSSVRYNARGQRTEATGGWSGTTAGVLLTTYRYDPKTFRLARLKTRRSLLTTPESYETLQDLVYAFDAVGNPTRIWDHAQDTLYYRNTVVDPTQAFVYDALYRLVSATGREHASHGGGLKRQQGLPYGPGALVHRADGAATRTYRQEYAYDAVGNLLRMQHTDVTPGAGWTRLYSYRDRGDGRRWNNQLVDTTIGSDETEYAHDLHGNMTTLPGLTEVTWDLFDRLSGITKTANWAASATAPLPDHDDEPDGAWVDPDEEPDSDPTDDVWVDGGANAAVETDPGPSHQWYYVYDGSGQRVRKVRAASGSGDAMAEERVYLGATWERWRSFASEAEELTTVHVMDDQRRVAMVESTVVEGEVEDVRWRFQLENHLGTATGEVTPTGEVISYEEFHPYGTTAVWTETANPDHRVSGKRYRYTGMERDDETGLQYHSARYYSTATGRWTAVDPIGVSGGVNLFVYCSGSPTSRTDVGGTDDGPGTFARVSAAVWDWSDDGLGEQVRGEWAEWLGVGGQSAPQSDLKPVIPPEEQPESSSSEYDYSYAQIPGVGSIYSAIYGAHHDEVALVDADREVARALAAKDAWLGTVDAISIAPDAATVASTGVRALEASARVGTEASAAVGPRAVSALVSVGGRAPAASTADAVLPFADDVASVAATGSVPSGSVYRGSVNLDTGTASAFVSEGSPVRHMLKEQLDGRSMVMTETAASEFSGMLQVAGPLEAARAGRLMQRVAVIPDDPSARALGLVLTRKVGAADRIIFGTGDKLGIPTMTSDAKFLRGAAAQGVDFDAILHPPVPLTGL